MLIEDVCFLMLLMSIWFGGFDGGYYEMILVVSVVLSILVFEWVLLIGVLVWLMAILVVLILCGLILWAIKALPS